MPKTGKPDTSDAQVMIALYEAQAAHNLDEAMGYIWSNDFPTDFKEFRQSFPQGSNSAEERNVHRALGHLETIGTLYRNNLINEDLLFDWLAPDHLFARVKGFVLGVRKEIGQPRMLENFEYMARRNANWKPARSRPSAAKRPAAKRPAAKRAAAAKRTRPAAAKRARPAAAKRTRPAAAKRTRPAAAKRTRPAAAKRTRPAAAKRARPAAAKRTRPAAAKRTRPAAAKRTRPAAAKRAPAAKRTAAARRTTARRTTAARKQG